MKLISWNVNGSRVAMTKGFMDAITIEACVAGRSNYSGTAPGCVARQMKIGQTIVAEELAQIQQWKERIHLQ